jgi:hypothetical protein
MLILITIITCETLTLILTLTLTLILTLNLMLHREKEIWTLYHLNLLIKRKILTLNLTLITCETLTLTLTLIAILTLQEEGETDTLSPRSLNKKKLAERLASKKKNKGQTLSGGLAQGGEPDRVSVREREKMTNRLLSELEAEHVQSVLTLCATLSTVYEKKDSEEDLIRERLQENLATIDIMEEVERLKSEWARDSDEFQLEHEGYIILINENCRIEKLLKKDSNTNIDHNSNANPNPENMVAEKDMLELLEKELEVLTTCSEKLIAEDRRVFQQENEEMAAILSLTLAWGPKVDSRARQSLLHQRVIERMRQEADMQMRLAMTEFNLRAEVRVRVRVT